MKGFEDMLTVLACIAGTAVGLFGLALATGIVKINWKFSARRMSKEERKKHGNLIINGKKIF